MGSGQWARATSPILLKALRREISLELLMARAELVASWITSKDKEAIRGAAVGILNEHKFRCQEESAGEIIASQGSQFLTRLLGGWFVPASWLPKRVSVAFRQKAD